MGSLWISYGLALISILIILSAQLFREPVGEHREGTGNVPGGHRKGTGRAPGPTGRRADGPTGSK